MFNLGIMNLRGYGVLENSPKAVHWFEEGAKLGDSEAQFFTLSLWLKDKVLSKTYLLLKNGLRNLQNKVWPQHNST